MSLLFWIGGTYTTRRIPRGIKKSSKMNQTNFESDNTRNCTLESTVPDRTKTNPSWMGIDEAGRGPVLGPMVYGTCYSPLMSKDKLADMGLADSKTLNEEQRDKIFGKINSARDIIGWIVELLTPTYISNSMLRRSKYNLNTLSHDCAIGLIRKVLDKGVNVTEVYIDTVGDPGKYQSKLKAIFPDLDITVAKKADATYSICSGASICAKVARDMAVKNWKFPELPNTDDLCYGSGYPSDPATKKFLKNHIDHVFGYPGFVRFSWSTASIILDKQAVPIHWEDDEEDEKENKTNTPSVFSFFQKTNENPKQKRHVYFTERCLKSVTEL